MLVALEGFLSSHQCAALTWGLRSPHTGASLCSANIWNSCLAFGGVFIAVVYITRPRLNFQNQGVAGCWLRATGLGHHTF